MLYTKNQQRTLGHQKSPAILFAVPRKKFSLPKDQPTVPKASPQPLAVSRAPSRWIRGAEIAGMTALLLVLGYFLQKLNLVNYSAVTPTGAIKLGTVFTIGLVAAVSTCMALVGGMLLSVSAAWKQERPNAGILQTFEPLLYFNIGRLLGYFFFGGMIGFIGSRLFVSPAFTSLVTIIIAVFMIVLGLRILNIIPKKYCSLPFSPALRRKMKGLEESGNPSAAALLGALTFFVPCGFTQSMQLLALSSGSYLGGGLIMLAFAFGTLPSLLGISVLSSLVQGKLRHLFFTFSGTAVILLGIQSMGNGLALAGVDPVHAAIRTFSSSSTATEDPFVTIDAQGRQIIAMYVSDKGYSPASFTIEKNRETWIYVIAKDQLAGCVSFMNVPAHGLSVPLTEKGTTWLGSFVPQQDFLITCSMGMFKANVRVL